MDAVNFQHEYYLCSSTSSWQCYSMARGPEGEWEISCLLGYSGEEEFHFVRDRDPRQAIYPASAHCMSTAVAACGPDSLGRKKSWRVRGKVNEEVKIRLWVVDAAVAVEVISDSEGTRVWENWMGYDRHKYSVVGSWSRDTIPLEHDPTHPGTYKCKGVIGYDFNNQVRGYAEFFHIVVDDEEELGIYPDQYGVVSGEAGFKGPDGKRKDEEWLVKSFQPGAEFEISLNLQERDRRNAVTYRFVDRTAALLRLSEESINLAAVRGSLPALGDDD